MFSKLAARLLFVVLVCSCCLAGAQKGSAPEAKSGADPLEVLGRWVGGTWHVTGKTVDSPYSQAGDINGSTNCAWSPEHVFVVCDQKFTANGKPGRSLSLYAYDAEAKTYRFWGLGPTEEQVRRPQLKINGDTWTYESEVSIAEHKVRFRTTNVWETNDRVAFKTEYSVDGGEFKPMNSGTNARTR